MSFHPQTPQSPSKASPTTSSETIPSLSTSMTSVGTLPTPAHSVNGSVSQLDIMAGEDSPQKRKRSIDDLGDRDSKKIHLENQKLSMDDLHTEVGHKYLLCQTSHQQSYPRITDDLYEMFDLADLAAEVAREKPNGEKNALRKTYKGHIKRLGVAGHFDVAKKAEDAPSELLTLANAPELEWNVHEVKGREIGDGLSDATLAALPRAMAMAKGPIPKNVWDTSVLGDLAQANGDKTSALGKPTAPSTPTVDSPLNIPKTRPTGPPGQDPSRPKRNVRKRTYGDSSFEGYGEGFPDDDGAETGYDTGDGEAGQKRRKQNPDESSPYPGPVRQQTYGPGMVGA